MVNPPITDELTSPRGKPFSHSFFGWAERAPPPTNSVPCWGSLGNSGITIGELLYCYNIPYDTMKFCIGIRLGDLPTRSLSSSTSLSSTLSTWLFFTLFYFCKFCRGAIPPTQCRTSQELMTSRAVRIRSMSVVSRRNTIQLSQKALGRPQTKPELMPRP